MGKFSIGDGVIWKKQQRVIVGIEKGEPTTKPQYQSGIAFTGYQGSAKKYVLDDGSKVTGQDLINHIKILEQNGTKTS